MSTAAEAFLSEIDGFLEETKMTASAFGWEAVKDRNFVGDLRAGRQPSLGMVDRVHQYMASSRAEKESAA